MRYNERCLTYLFRGYSHLAVMLHFLLQFLEVVAQIQQFRKIMTKDHSTATNPSIRFLNSTLVFCVFLETYLKPMAEVMLNGRSDSNVKLMQLC